MMDRDGSPGSSDSSWVSFVDSDEERAPSPTRPQTREMAVDEERAPSPTRPQTREMAVDEERAPSPTRPQTREMDWSLRRVFEICNWPLSAFRSRSNQIEVENHLQLEEIQLGLRQADDITPALAMSAEEFIVNMLQRVTALMNQIVANEVAEGQGIDTDD